MNLKLCLLAGLALLAAPGAAMASGSAPAKADLILVNGKIWTADPSHPYAQAVATRGDRILAVGSDAEALRFRSGASKVIDLRQQFLTPGFIDGHTHFENATEWYFEALITSVDSEPELLDRLKAAAERVPKGMWITGGDWGELEARKVFKRGDAAYLAFSPSLAEVDAVTPDHPVLIRRHNGDYFANSLGLKLLRITKNQPNPPGGAYEHDPKTGELTGMLLRRAGERAAQALPPKTMARTLIAARALMRELNSFGITGINDISRVDEVSQEQVFKVDVERSHSDVNIFKRLRDEGDLTVRVYAMLPLVSWSGLARHGIAPGSGDKWIQYGALKSFLDGRMMYQPYADNPNYGGDFTYRVTDPDQMRRDFVAADKAGWDMATHQLGDKATGLYLDWVDAAIRANGPRDRRERLIHFEYPNLEEIKRAGAMHAFADITPFHMIMDMDGVEKQMGPERAKTAFAGRTLIDNGVRINLVSDWPGDYYKTVAKPINPLEQIYYAVTRHRIGEGPEKAWHPQEDITIEEGLQAYTINPAAASHEEKLKGSIAKGKLADFALLSRDIIGAKPEDLLTTKVVMTIVGGRIVYRAEPDAR